MTVYEIVTKEIIKELEKGNIPWNNPCLLNFSPKNFISKKSYRGINKLLLSMGSSFMSNYYLTFKQVLDLGYSVNTGAKSKMVVFWSLVNKKSNESFEETDSEEKLQKGFLY